MELPHFQMGMNNSKTNRQFSLIIAKTIHFHQFRCDENGEFFSRSASIPSATTIGGLSVHRKLLNLLFRVNILV